MKKVITAYMIFMTALAVFGILRVVVGLIQGDINNI
jgi:hypothetical protein